MHDGVLLPLLKTQAARCIATCLGRLSSYGNKVESRDTLVSLAAELAGGGWRTAQLLYQRVGEGGAADARQRAGGEDGGDKSERFNCPQ